MTYLALFPIQKCQIAIFGIIRNAKIGTANRLISRDERTIPKAAIGITRPVLSSQNHKKSMMLRFQEDLPNTQSWCQDLPSRSGHCHIKTGTPSTSAGAKKCTQYFFMVVSAQKVESKRSAPKEKM